MLNEMYPKKLSNYQFYFTSLGVVITGVGTLLENIYAYRVGLVLITVGAFFLLLSVKFMLSFGKKDS